MSCSIRHLIAGLLYNNFEHNLILGKMIFEVRSHVCKLPDNYVLGIMISIEQWNIRNYLRIFQPWLISFRLRDYFKKQAKLLFRNLRSNHFLKFKIILLLIFWSYAVFEDTLLVLSQNRKFNFFAMKTQICFGFCIKILSQLKGLDIWLYLPSMYYVQKKIQNVVSLVNLITKTKEV